MATFEKRGKFWRVKVRRERASAQTRTPSSWHAPSRARSTTGSSWIAERPGRTSLAQVLKRYRCEATPTKRGSADAHSRCSQKSQSSDSSAKQSAV
jgi:hypothetical protein